MSFPKPHRCALLAGHVDHRKAGRAQTLCGAILLFADLEADITGAKLRRPAPHQELVAAPERLALFVNRLREAVERGRLGRSLGLDAFSRLEPIPPTRRHRAVV